MRKVLDAAPATQCIAACSEAAAVQWNEASQSRPPPPIALSLHNQSIEPKIRMSDSQTEPEAGASDASVSRGIHTTSMRSPSTTGNRYEQGGREMTAETLDTGDGEGPSDKDTHPLVKAKIPGRNLFTSVLTVPLLLFLLCLLFSILLAALTLLHLFTYQKKRWQPSDTSLNEITIGTNLQSGAETSEANSDLIVANTELSLEDTLRAGQDAFEQFLASQRDEDLGDCIKSWKEALALCPISHDGRSSILKNLGKLLRTRFDRTGDVGDLEGSIRHQQAALSLWPMGHPILPSSQSNLGNALRTRFNLLGDMADLEESIRHYRGALSLHPVGHADRPDSLNNLSDVLKIRFDRMSDEADLEESTRLSQEALSFSCGDGSAHSNNLDSVLPLEQSSSQGTAPMEEARTEEVSSGPSTGTTPRAQRSTVDGNTTGQQGGNRVNSSDEVSFEPI
ncbi:hypothetical protein FRB95_005066 [Tulasnella sp. JGI-2019a]|nr:hypothetical protein FRB95_005066 [Tulasnella sp. JGI-2019a]